MTAYRSLASWRGEGPFGAWLTRIAVRIALRQVGQRRSVRWLDPSAGAGADGGDPASAASDAQAIAVSPRTDPAMLALRAEREADLRAAVSTLPEPYRETVTLRFFGELVARRDRPPDRTSAADRQDAPPPRPPAPARDRRTLERRMSGPHRPLRPVRAADARRHRAVRGGARRCTRRGARARGARGERGHPPDRGVRRPGDGCDRPRTRPARGRLGRQRRPRHGTRRLPLRVPQRLARRHDRRPAVRGPGPGPRLRVSSCSLPQARWPVPAPSRSRACSTGMTHLRPRSSRSRPPSRRPTCRRPRRPRRPPNRPDRRTDRDRRADRDRRTDRDRASPTENAGARRNARTHRRQQRRRWRTRVRRIDDGSSGSGRRWRTRLRRIRARLTPRTGLARTLSG